MSVDTKMLSLFFEETKEHIKKMIESLLELETDPSNMNYFNRLIRSVHTIKGSITAMNYTATSKLVHRLEDLIQAIQDGKLTLNGKIMRVLFHSHDFLEKFLKAAIDGIGEDCFNCTFIIGQINGILHDLEAKNKNQDMSGYQHKDILINSERFGKLEEGIKEGKQLVDLHIKMSDSCTFKSIGLWMSFEEVEKNAEILASLPQKPTEEEFKKGSDNLDTGEVEMLLLSYKSAEEIVNELRTMVTDADIIDAEELEYSKNKSSVVLSEKEILQNELCSSDNCVCYIEMENDGNNKAELKKRN